MSLEPGSDGRARAHRPPVRALASHLSRAVIATGERPTGMELAATVLWARSLRFDASDPDWPDRDRFVLSGTRFDPLLSALLRLSGHGEVPAGTVFGHHPAVEIAPGPPGQGFAAAVGMAIAERALARRFGRTLVDHRTWVLACETDLAAGVSLEAAALAARLELDKLVVIADGAGGGLPGSDERASVGRFAAAGWAVRQADRDDPDALTAAIAGAMRDRRPTLLCCVPGAPATEIADPTWEESAPATDAIAEWTALGRRHAPARRSWLRRKVRHRDADAFDRAIGGHRPDSFRECWRVGCAEPLEGDAAADPIPSGALAGARHGLRLLDRLLPELAPLRSAAGAALASLPGEAEPPTEPGARSARVLECGVAEHGMAAIGNGLALHGGAIPVVQAGLISVDRMRPALRLAALMGQRVIFLLHDERRGAAWQTVEQLASLRAMPNVMLFRPADAAEALACWELALGGRPGPRVIALAETETPEPGPANPEADPDRARDHCARGGYVRYEPPTPRQATLLATGPEVAVAMAAARSLATEGIAVAVASLPCWELFAAQPSAYRAAILGEAPRIGIEAASGFGWERWLGPDGSFIGLDGFGAAGPVASNARPSGPSPEPVAERVRHSLGRGGT